MADLFGLGGYRSDGSDEHDGTARQGLATPAELEDDSTEDSSDVSVDSAKARALEAEARLKDYDEQGGGKQGGVLPSVLDAFDEVEGPPEFLDPQATRPLARASAHGATRPAAGTTPAGSSTAQTPAGFDIARLAPKLKQPRREGDERAEGGSVIEGRAKKAAAQEGVEATQQYSDLQIAMLGGTLQKRHNMPGPAPPPELPALHGKRPSGAMDVAEFLNKGQGAALLPRKGTDRLDKERAKRMKQQSGVTGWKSEAEMVLRQQYDS